MPSLDEIAVVRAKLKEVVENSILAEAQLSDLEDQLEKANLVLCAAQSEREEESRLEKVISLQQNIKQKKTEIKELIASQEKLEQKIRMLTNTSPHRGE